MNHGLTQMNADVRGSEGGAVPIFAVEESPAFRTQKPELWMQRERIRRLRRWRLAVRNTSV